MGFLRIGSMSRSVASRTGGSGIALMSDRANERLGYVLRRGS